MKPVKDSLTALTGDNSPNQIQNLSMCNRSAHTIPQREVTYPQGASLLHWGKSFLQRGSHYFTGEVTVPQESSTAPFGLWNQGSTCYLNSVLQVLFMTGDVRQALDKKEQSRELNDTEQVLKNLFQNLERGECGTKSITEHLQIKDVYKQRDAREHLELLLNHMSPEVSEPFLGELLYETTCSKGHCVIEEPYPIWTLPLTLSQDSSVQEALNHMVKPSEFSFYCSDCEEDTTVTRVCEMTKPPVILALLLKWSDTDECAYYNYSSDVEIPVKRYKRVPYSLCGVVDHWGSKRGGRYTATLRCSEDGHWYYFNDCYVRRVEVPDEMSSSAYLLLYRAAHVKEETVPSGVDDPQSQENTVPPAQLNEEDSDEQTGRRKSPEHRGEYGPKEESRANWVKEESRTKRAKEEFRE